jgi:hypothetical protein
LKEKKTGENLFSPFFLILRFPRKKDCNLGRKRGRMLSLFFVKKEGGEKQNEKRRKLAGKISLFFGKRV